MDQTGTPDAGSPTVEVLRYTFLSLALAVASLLLLPFYGLALVVLPLPALVATMRYGAWAGVIVAVAAALPVTALAGPGLGVAVALIVLALGVGQALLTAAGVHAGRMLTFCIAVFVAAACAAAASAFVSGAITAAELAKASQLFQAEFARYAGGSAAQTARAAKELGDAYIYLLPSGLIVLCLATGLANFLVSQVLLQRRSLPSAALARFSEWQIPWYLAWGFLVGLACAVGYRYLAPAHRQPALYAGLNLIVIFGTLYMVQGLAIVFSLFDRFKLAPPVRGVLLVLAAFLQLFVQALTWLGLFDTWFDYRKLNKEE